MIRGNPIEKVALELGLKEAGVTLESALGKGMLSRADSRSRGPRGLFTLFM